MESPLGRHFETTTSDGHYVGRCVTHLYKGRQNDLRLKVVRTIRGVPPKSGFLQVPDLSCWPTPPNDPLLLTIHRASCDSQTDVVKGD